MRATTFSPIGVIQPSASLRDERWEHMLKGCACVGECTAANKCACIVGGRDYYTDEGRLATLSEEGSLTCLFSFIIALCRRTLKSLLYSRVWRRMLLRTARLTLPQSRRAIWCATQTERHRYTHRQGLRRLRTRGCSTWRVCVRVRR